MHEIDDVQQPRDILLSLASFRTAAMQEFVSFQPLSSHVPHILQPLSHSHRSMLHRRRCCRFRDDATLLSLTDFPERRTRDGFLPHFVSSSLHVRQWRRTCTSPECLYTVLYTFIKMTLKCISKIAALNGENDDVFQPMRSVYPEKYPN